MWRQYLESLTHDENCFVTLTYSPENLPGAGNLEPGHVSLWLKRLRWVLSPVRIRYFLAGEYGDETFRPHYHLSLFGVSGDTVVTSPSGPDSVANLIARTWAKGNVHVAEFNELTAQYIAGYVTKKMNQKDDPRLQGRVPEFARMSRRPGIGANAMGTIAAAWLKSKANGSPPTFLTLGRRKIMLGRYMLKKLREACGLTPDQIDELKSEVSYESSLEMQALLLRQLSATPLAPVTAKTLYFDETNQKVLQVESRHRIYKKRSTL